MQVNVAEKVVWLDVPMNDFVTVQMAQGVEEGPDIALQKVCRHCLSQTPRFVEDDMVLEELCCQDRCAVDFELCRACSVDDVGMLSQDAQNVSFSLQAFKADLGNLQGKRWTRSLARNALDLDSVCPRAQLPNETVRWLFLLHDLSDS